MSDAAVPTITFAENAARMRAAGYRTQAAHFRLLAQVETLNALRRHLLLLAAEYQAMADAAEGSVKSR